MRSCVRLNVTAAGQGATYARVTVGADAVVVHGVGSVTSRSLALHVPACCSAE